MHKTHGFWDFYLESVDLPDYIEPGEAAQPEPEAVEEEVIGGVDGYMDWLPPGPIPVKPEHDIDLIKIPEAALTLSHYVKSVGWTLDGSRSAYEGNERRIEQWWAEIADEQGVAWLNTQY